MNSVYMEAPRKVYCKELPQPQVGPEDVLIRVQNVGLCGTDLSSYRGKAALTKYPLVPGHELGGTVCALGADVPKAMFPEGAHVTVKPYFNCGACYPCGIGRINCCKNSRTMGVQMPEGALSEYIAVPYRNVIDCGALSCAEMALAEPLCIGAHLVNRAGVQPGENVVVFGCGVIGLGAIAAASCKGAVVTAVDIADKKLDTARAMGAKYAVNTRSEDLDAKLQEYLGGAVHVALEAIGLPQTMRRAVEIVEFGGRVGYVGYGSGKLELDANLIVKKELNIFGSRNALQSDFISVISNLQGKRLPFTKLISATYPAAQAAQAFADWDADPDRFVKIQIEF